MSRSSKKKLILLTVVFVTLYLPPPVSGSFDERERGYLLQKSAGNYAAALDTLESMTFDTDSPSLIETNLFRIQELLSSSDLIAKGLGVLDSLAAGHRTIAGNEFLRARLQVMRNRLLLRQGNAREAVAIRDALGFISSFNTIGPFPNIGGEGFDTSFPPEREFNPAAAYTGRTAAVEWFSVSADLSGSVDFGDLFESTADSIFYLRTQVSVLRGGNYILLIGKAGFTDIWIDGVRVFSNRSAHQFSFDQYHVELRLSAGIHTVLIKTANSASGNLRVSLRLADSDGKPLAATARTGMSPGSCSPVRAGYFNSLRMLIEAASSGPAASFHAGYLHSITGLSSENGREAFPYFEKSSAAAELSPAAHYYLAMLESSPGSQEYHLERAIRARPDNLEALVEMARRRIGQDRFFEAYPFLEQARKTGAQTALFNNVLAEFLLRKGWQQEAQKMSAPARSSGLALFAEELDARIAFDSRRYRDSAALYGELYRLDRGSLDFLDRHVQSCEKAGQIGEAISTLTEAAGLYPNNTSIRLRLAGLVAENNGPAAALPYLAAVLRLSPNHPKALLQTGLVYHRTGKDDLARFYLRNVLAYDPKNFAVARYLHLIEGSADELDPYLVHADPVHLSLEAERHRKEPAVNLLNETTYRIMRDGSYEKAAHRIVQINDASVITGYSRFSFVINPSTDRVENIECQVINGTEKVTTSEAFSQSLSDPESRLYYDLSAYTVIVPALRKGSIVSFKYRVSSRSGEINKNYFGTHIFAGDKNRTIKTNIVISMPEGYPLSSYLRGIDRRTIAETRASTGRKVFRVTLSDTAPIRLEPSMPDYTEFVPTVFLTTHRSWNDLYRWYYPLVENRIVMSDEMRLDLASIITRDMRPIDRVRAVFAHVTSSIRYVGFELGLGGIQPRRSDETYRSRMGDCKDIALVLVAMLRAAGIDASLALVRTNERGEADLSIPYLGHFNHAICYVNIDGGFFLDGTSRFSGFRELPGADHLTRTLVLNERGFRFVTAASRLFIPNTVATDNEVKLYPDGSARILRGIYKEGGMFAPQARASLLDRGRLKTTISEYWNNVYTGARILDLNVLESGNEKPVTYQYIVKAPSYCQGAGDDIIFRSFFYDSEIYQNLAMLKERRYPVVLSDEHGSRETIRYEIPEGYRAYRIPEGGVFTHPKFEAAFSYKLDETSKKIEVTGAISYKSRRIEPADYSAFRAFARFIHKKENEKIILTKIHQEKK